MLKLYTTSVRSFTAMYRVHGIGSFNWNPLSQTVVSKRLVTQIADRGWRGTIQRGSRQLLLQHSNFIRNKTRLAAVRHSHALG